jgi:hypothetical protein
MECLKINKERFYKLERDRHQIGKKAWIEKLTLGKEVRLAEGRALVRSHLKRKIVTRNELQG